jgi:hypothetical protein
MNSPSSRLGFTREGLKMAITIKDNYRNRQPICIPGEGTSMLIPEHLLNDQLDLREFDDPLPLAMMATRDPESPMALAAVTRLGRDGRKHKLAAGVFDMVGQTTKHALVKKCVQMIEESAFNPAAIAKVRLHATEYVLRTRKQYTVALRQNLKALLDGNITPRGFVDEFFVLTETGNMRHDIRRKLVMSLLLSETIRPSIKFLILENFDRMPDAVRGTIAANVLRAKPTRHTVLIQEELKWIVAQEKNGLALN